MNDRFFRFAATPILLLGVAFFSAPRGEIAHAQPGATPSVAAPLPDVKAVQQDTGRPYIATPDAGGALMATVKAATVERMANGGFEDSKNGFPSGWQKWGAGGELARGAGHGGGTAFVAERKDGEDARGAGQLIVLNQTRPEPVFIEGWSKAENVSGTRDGDYAIYCDVTYTDNTNLWGVTRGFATGTHDWQKETVLVAPDKPIKSLMVYALFRDHTGKVWFDDFRADTARPGEGGVFFDGVPVRVLPQNKASWDAAEFAGIKSLLGDAGQQAGSTPGGFLARDVANNSGYYSFQNGECAPLKLKLDYKVETKADHVAILGSVEDATKMDRAICLVFALPIDARGWTWGDDIRTSQAIAQGGEYSRARPIGSGSNGKQSVYPLANIHNQATGLALALDMNFPAQYRLAYNADTRQFFIAYDFGLAPEKPRAEFRFVIYRTEPQSGFRSAVERLQKIFPAYFALRNGNQKQGLWMPFYDISKVEKPQDFGFRFREAGESAAKDGSAAWDDAHDVLTLLYSEPMTYWMVMPPEMPRTYEAALAELQRIAADEKHAQNRFARAVLSSGVRDENGQLAVLFLDRPWANGAVWSLNVAPGLSGAGSTPAAGAPITGATLVWNANKLERLKNKAGAKIDGEYLDSFEGYVTGTLNFARDQFAAQNVPLTFDQASFRPAQHKGFAATELARWMSRDVRAAGGLMMANSIPHRFGIAAPWMDIMGTETNWKPADHYAPDSDAEMNLRRTLSGPKPYLLLQNTNFNNFSHDDVQRYMERSLFYGIFPGFFSHNAATDVYWQNPALYNRDRDLFLKYIPVVRVVAEAGWQPLTKAASDNANIWLERFGEENEIYLTLRNNAETAQTAHITLSEELNEELKAGASVAGVLPAMRRPVQNGGFEISLQPDQTAVVRVR